ncbi:hypothetical protein CLF_101386 [Clonorchis sinensis]|uniref:Uncharacterized protein n=1 Tax=Clonorchis sinensis TaxID=79923 RepID=G7Y5M4_CLOSI|nr:hypothetical protein CLF_101386 [Clonorchis sinensis]
MAVHHEPLVHGGAEKLCLPQASMSYRQWQRKSLTKTKKLGSITAFRIDWSSTGDTFKVNRRKFSNDSIDVWNSGTIVFSLQNAHLARSLDFIVLQSLPDKANPLQRILNKSLATQHIRQPFERSVLMWSGLTNNETNRMRNVDLGNNQHVIHSCPLVFVVDGNRAVSLFIVRLVIPLADRNANYCKAEPDGLKIRTNDPPYVRNSGKYKQEQRVSNRFFQVQFTYRYQQHHHRQKQRLYIVTMGNLKAPTRLVLRLRLHTFGRYCLLTPDRQGSHQQRCEYRDSEKLPAFASLVNRRREIHGEIAQPITPFHYLTLTCASTEMEHLNFAVGQGRCEVSKTCAFCCEYSKLTTCRRLAGFISNGDNHQIKSNVGNTLPADPPDGNLISCTVSITDFCKQETVRYFNMEELSTVAAGVLADKVKASEFVAAHSVFAAAVTRCWLLPTTCSTTIRLFGTPSSDVRKCVAEQFGKVLTNQVFYNYRVKRQFPLFRGSVITFFGFLDDMAQITAKLRECGHVLLLYTFLVTDCMGIGRSVMYVFVESEHFAHLRKPFCLFIDKMGGQYSFNTFVADKMTSQVRTAKAVFGCDPMLCYFYAYTTRGFYPSCMPPDPLGGKPPGIRKCVFCNNNLLQLPDLLSGQWESGASKMTQSAGTAAQEGCSRCASTGIEEWQEVIRAFAEEKLSQIHLTSESASLSLAEADGLCAHNPGRTILAMRPTENGRSKSRTHHSDTVKHAIWASRHAELLMREYEIHTNAPEGKFWREAHKCTAEGFAKKTSHDAGLDRSTEFQHGVPEGLISSVNASHQ